ncbi:Maf family protein [Flavitalea flava]
MEHIVLASGSPRRKQLLEWAEIRFEVIVKETAETFPPDLPIGEVPVHIARNKAFAVKKEILGKVWDDGKGTDKTTNQDPVIIAADTVVVLGEEIIGKPRDRMDAIGILKRLAGNKHEVITGVVILKGEKEISFADTTAVWFHELTDEQIEGYVDRYKPYDKAGAYAIQEWIGVVGIRSIQGDFYNVMGLPVSRVVRALEQL